MNVLETSVENNFVRMGDEKRPLKYTDHYFGGSWVFVDGVLRSAGTWKVRNWTESEINDYEKRSETRKSLIDIWGLDTVEGWHETRKLVDDWDHAVGYYEEYGGDAPEPPSKYLSRDEECIELLTRDLAPCHVVVECLTDMPSAGVNLGWLTGNDPQM